MRVLRKTWVLILIDVLLFTAVGMMILNAFFSLAGEKEIVLADNVFNLILIFLIFTSILHIIVSILEFINKKFIKGLLILFYTPFKLYLILTIWFFYFIIVRGGLPVDDYESRNDFGEMEILK